MSRGPVGKRSDAKHGHRTQEELNVDTAPGGAAIVWGDPDPEWHPRAVELFEAAQVSGQSVFYEQSDVAILKYVCDGLSRSLQSGRFSGQLFASVVSSMSDLVLTEGSRRRLKLELQRDMESAESGPSEVDLAIQQLSSIHADS